MNCKILDGIGQGSFSIIHKCIYNDLHCVVKKFRIIDQKEIWIHECEVLSKLSKQAQLYSLKKYAEFYTDTGYIVMEEIPGATLSKIIETKNVKKRTKHMYIIKDLIKGINYIHQSGIAHLDVKDENIMFDGVKFRYIDFGCSAIQGQEKIRHGTLYSRCPDVNNISWEILQSMDYWGIGIVFLRWFGLEWDEDFYVKLYNLYGQVNMKDIENIAEETLFPIYGELSTEFLHFLISQVDKKVQETIFLLLEKNTNQRILNFSRVFKNL